MTKNDWYINLAAAIVRDVMDDYRISARTFLDKTERKDEREKARNRLKRLEVWLISSYGQLLSMNHGEYIIECLRKECGLSKI